MEENAHKDVFADLVWAGDEQLFIEKLDKKMEVIQGNEFKIVDIKFAVNEGQYLALIIYKSI